MRKYYSVNGPACAGLGSQMNSNVHWELLASYVKGSVDVLDFATYNRCLTICDNHDVTGYLKLSSDLDLLSQRYTVNQDPEVVYVHRQIVSFLKKFPFTTEESGLDPKASATVKLLEAERSCQITNSRLRECSREQLPLWVPKAKKLISDVLGSLTPTLTMQIISRGGHGPGATLSSKGNRVTQYYKYADLPYSVTKSAQFYAFAAISSNPRWIDFLEDTGRRKELPPFGAPAFQKELMLLNECIELVDSDKVTFVPKDARTERPIAVGASLNMFLQLGVKAYMQERLKLVGVDLSDQSKNKKLAYQGSRYSGTEDFPNLGQFSTIDLSSASDTISLELVKLLLDPDWFAFLSDLRHESGSIDGEILVYEKFSAMGNGFTFPLESLIFWAVTKATIQETEPNVKVNDIAVYGDDIIIRFYHSAACIDSLIWCGFAVNQEKSFLSGPFKESCGADYFKGTDVRPFYLKRRVERVEDCYFICNSIADKMSSRLDRRGLISLYHECIGIIPLAQRCYSPIGDTSASGLNVPLSFISSIGLRPYLTKREKSHLINRNLLKEEGNYQNGLYCFNVSYQAKSYSGRSKIRLLLALDEQLKVRDSPFIYKGEKLIHLEAASSGSVTRRNSVKRFVNVRLIHNWNGSYTNRELLLHPAWSVPYRRKVA